MESIDRAREELRNVEELISGYGGRRGEYANKLAALEARRRQLLAILEERRNEGETRKKMNRASHEKNAVDGGQLPSQTTTDGVSSKPAEEPVTTASQETGGGVGQGDEEELNRRLARLRARCNDIRATLDEMEIVIDSMCCLKQVSLASPPEGSKSSTASGRSKDSGAAGKSEMLNDLLSSPEIQKLVGQLIAGFLK